MEKSSYKPDTNLPAVNNCYPLEFYMLEAIVVMMTRSFLI